MPWTAKARSLDILVQPRRDRKAALKLMRKLLKKQGVTPATIVTNKLGSYSSAPRESATQGPRELAFWSIEGAPALVPNRASPLSGASP